jgi:hypothetical protein
MYLELAEKGRRSKRVRVNTYARTPYVKSHSRKYPSLSDGTENPYHIYIAPELNDGVGLFVREDYFDSLSENEFEAVMAEIELYEDGISGKGKQRRTERRERRQERKEKKTARKDEKQARKTLKKDNKIQRKADRNTRKNDKRASKDSARATKAQAKLTKAEKKGSTDWGGIIDSAGGVIGKFTGKGGDSDSTAADASITNNTGGGDSGASGGGSNNGDGTILGMPKTAVIIGAVAVLGIGAFMVMKKK